MNPEPLTITVANQQDLLPVDEERLRHTAGRVLADAARGAGSLSIAVVDDATIRPINAEFLGHDYATDVLSFALEDDGNRLEGEVIVSAETAIANAADYDAAPEDELLLYVIHGTLHLVGYNDKTEAEATAMRRAEAAYLRPAGAGEANPA
ncbi:MAG: rRNA maturation RNase YbeY [Planctomycetota bacterium]